MKKLVLLASALVANGFVCAQDVGRVLSSTPVTQQVAVPRQVCTTEQVAVQQPKSGAGAVLGAIAGGAMGNAVGGGSGKAAATMIGIMGGAMVGDHVEGAPMAQVQNVQRCAVQNVYENRVLGYNVVYEFAGKQYAVQMPRDPGTTVALQVAPVGMNDSLAPPAYSNVEPQPVYVQPPQVIVAQQTYPVYAARPYFPPVFPPISLQFGYGWGGDHHRSHGHWR